MVTKAYKCVPPQQITTNSQMWRFGHPRKRHLLILLLFLISFLILRSRYESESPTESTAPKFSNLKKAMSMKTFKALKLAEYEYRTLLRKKSEAEITELESLYHRDLRFNWDNEFGWLPPSKPLFYKQCLRYLEKSYAAKVSVVLSFKDELLSILLRTLTTLVFRTPVSLLQEIVLVDDGSFQDNKDDVLKHFQLLEVPLRWYRRNDSIGIANARHFGIEKATGDVVVILDSHMVVSDVWLQPLLATLANRPRGVVVPLVQMIMDDEYHKFHLLKINPYAWKMVRGYQGLDFTDFSLNSTDETQPYPTPVIGGGALLAHRTTLLELWPRQMYPGSWGVENLRLSLRAWACGDGLWVSPCAKITHPNGKDPNLSRYKVNDPDLKKHRLSETAAEITNIMKSKREATRLIRSTYFAEFEENIFKTAEQMSETFNYTKCANNYTWYLNTVHRKYHYRFFDQSRFVHVGVFQSARDPRRCLVNIIGKNQVQTDTECASITNNQNHAAKSIDVEDPHLVGFSAGCALHGLCFPQGVFTTSDPYYSPTCWDAHSQGEHKPIKFWSCHQGPSQSPPQQHFQYNVTTQQIQHVPSHRCAEIASVGHVVELNRCDVEKVEQRWIKHSPSWWRN